MSEPPVHGALRRRWHAAGVALYNNLVTFVPSLNLRVAVLRLFGARVGKDCAIFRGTVVLGIETLVIGDATSIGQRCLLDARGYLTIGSNVVVASDTQFLTGTHEVNSDDFGTRYDPIVVEDYVWLASRVTVLQGVTMERGSVALACALVTRSAAPMAIVAGLPAKQVSVRESALTYSPVFRPLFY